MNIKLSTNTKIVFGIACGFVLALVMIPVLFVMATTVRVEDSEELPVHEEEVVVD